MWRHRHLELIVRLARHHIGATALHYAWKAHPHRIKSSPDPTSPAPPRCDRDAGPVLAASAGLRVAHLQGIGDGEHGVLLAEVAHADVDVAVVTLSVDRPYVMGLQITDYRALVTYRTQVASRWVFGLLGVRLREGV